MEARRLFYSFFIFGLLISPALANKASVSIEAPTVAKVNEEVTITINVTHRGNSRWHYINRVVVIASGREIARWNFTSDNRPEAEKFSREVKLKIQAETEIVAEANCNLHGSAGPAAMIIKIEEQTNRGG